MRFLIIKFEDVVLRMTSIGMKSALQQLCTMCPHALHIAAIPSATDPFMDVICTSNGSFRESIFQWMPDSADSFPIISQRLNEIGRTTMTFNFIKFSTTLIPALGDLLDDKNYVYSITIRHSWTHPVVKLNTSHMLIELLRRGQHSIKKVFMPLYVTHALDDWITFQPITRVERLLRLQLHVDDNLLASIDFLRQLLALCRTTELISIDFQKIEPHQVPDEQIANFVFCYLSTRAGKKRQNLEMTCADRIINYAFEQYISNVLMARKPDRIGQLFGIEMSEVFELTGVSSIDVNEVDCNHLIITADLPAFNNLRCQIGFYKTLPYNENELLYKLFVSNTRQFTLLP